MYRANEKPLAPEIEASLRKVRCPECDGSGRVHVLDEEGSHIVTCARCGGARSVAATYYVAAFKGRAMQKEGA